MKAYSIDLRQRVVAAYDAGEGTQEQLAARFAVSTSWVRKLLRQRRDTGSIEPRPHGGGHAPAFDAAADARLRQAVRDDSDATLEELGRAAGVACSRLGGVPGAWTGWGSRAKKVAAGGRAGPPRAEGRAGRLAGGVRRDRPGPAGLRRRVGGEHGDGPDPRPRPLRGAGRRAGAARPLEGHDADGRGAARRRAARRPAWPSTGRPTRPASRPTSSGAWCRPCGPATSW